MIDELKKAWSEINLATLLGKIERDNTDLSFYDDNPELLDRLGKEGVKVTEGNLLFDALRLFMPEEEKGRMQAFGNQILVPTEYMSDEDIIAMMGHGGLQITKEGDGDPYLSSGTSGLGYESIANAAIFEELPHTQQFRDKGFLGMGLSSLGDMSRAFVKEIKEGDFKTAFNPIELQKELYDMDHTLESFHADEVQKAELINEFLGEGSYFKERGWPYTEGKPFEVDNNLNVVGGIPEFPGYEYDGLVIPPYQPSGMGRERMGDMSYEYWDEIYGDDQAMLYNSRMPVEHLKNILPDKVEFLQGIINPTTIPEIESSPGTEVGEEFSNSYSYVSKDVNLDGVINLLDAMSLLSNQSLYGENYEQSDVDRITYQTLYDD